MKTGFGSTDMQGLKERVRCDKELWVGMFSKKTKREGGVSTKKTLVQSSKRGCRGLHIVRRKMVKVGGPAEQVLYNLVFVRFPQTSVNINSQSKALDSCHNLALV